MQAPGGLDTSVSEAHENRPSAPITPLDTPTELSKSSPTSDSKSAKSKTKAYPEAEPSNNVYLWGIPSTFTDADLSLLVFACGNVVSVRMGPPTNKPHTYAFAQFNNQEEAKKAIDLLNSRRLNQRELVVRFAKPPPLNSKHKKKASPTINTSPQNMYSAYPVGPMGAYDERKNSPYGYPQMDMYTHMQYPNSGPQ
ncbi:hypothetical protein AAMO2058_001135200, partial [Amorphochlora amoebiformis]